MRLKLLLCLVMLSATPAAAENWKPVPGEAGTYVDMDFVKVDQQTGLVVLRTAMGKPSGATYDEWTERDAITISAVDCKGDLYKDLGIDLDGDKGPPEGWRSRPSRSGAKFAVKREAPLPLPRGTPTPCSPPASPRARRPPSSLIASG